MGRSMESIALFFAVAFIGYIVYWSIRNDNVKSISEQTGFLKMKDQQDEGKERLQKGR